MHKVRCTQVLVTQEQRQIIEERFEKTRVRAAGRKDALFSVLDTCTEDEAICLKYLYAFMPEQDLANYDGELFLKFVRQALEMRQMVPWGDKLTGSLFLNYVLQYRINNENVEFYKEEFFNELYPRVKDMNMYDACIETNYWCFQKATYQSTDIRTASPFTVLRNAYGRCGEESTLAVAALRSIGIPARQIYAPRWAHCDDNHAWVEIWVDGEWHFLGACEPDAKLDTGWFMLPASKGMLIHNKVLSTIVEDEIITFNTDYSTEINVLHHYADTKPVTVTVKDTKGEPVEGARVRFELINYSELFALADLTTDANGQVNFVTGFGDLMVCAHNGKVHAYEQFDVRLADHLEITLPDTFIKEEAIKELVIVPAEGRVPTELVLTEEERVAHEAKHAKALEIRNAFRNTFYIGEKAENFAKDYAPFEVEVKEALEKSLGNYNEMMAFFQDEETKDLLEYKVKMLSTFNKKDFTDITCEIMKAHLLGAVTYKDAYTEEIFVPYLLAPRITFEMTTAYRQAICERFSAEEIESFKANPATVHEFVMTNIAAGEESEYSTFYACPEGLLDLKIGNILSKKVLCVAMWRAFGIAAKFNKADRSVSFYKDGVWTDFGMDETPLVKASTLTLTKEDDSLDFGYFRNFTVGVLINGVYQSLELDDFAWEGKSISYTVEAGRYRIITTNRQADGTLLTRIYYTDVVEGETSEVVIGITQEEGTKVNVDVKDQEVAALDGTMHKLSSLVKDTHNMIAYLAVAAEPTEHLLNEILESQEKFNSIKPNVILILENAEDYNNLTLQKVLKTVPHIGVYVGHEEAAVDTIYTGFDIQDRKLPLAYVMNEPMKAQYAWAGYNVGIGELLLKYLA